jgi:hypothetical protein
MLQSCLHNQKTLLYKFVIFRGFVNELFEKYIYEAIHKIFNLKVNYELAPEIYD